jgi:hypothetical protein
MWTTYLGSYQTMINAVSANPAPSVAVIVGGMSMPIRASHDGYVVFVIADACQQIRAVTGYPTVMDLSLFVDVPEVPVRGSSGLLMLSPPADWPPTAMAGWPGWRLGPSGRSRAHGRRWWWRRYAIPKDLRARRRTTAGSANQEVARRSGNRPVHNERYDTVRRLTALDSG